MLGSTAAVVALLSGLAAFELDASAGAYTMTGMTLTTERETYRLNAAPGAYSLLGARAVFDPPRSGGGGLLLRRRRRHQKGESS
jgi:hypothetical protein